MKQGELFEEARSAPRRETHERATKAPADAEHRHRAVSVFDRPILLEAGAGTGKTATLVARILSWSLGPGWDRHAGASRDAEDVALRVLQGVVAITFTEAAAAEMAGRVGAALAAVEGACAAGELDRERLPLGLAQELLPAAPELGARANLLRAALDHLNVSTIHAFCRRLLSQYPLEIGLSPDFEVDAAFTRQAIAVRDVLEAALRAAWTEGTVPSAGTLAHDLLALARRGIGPPHIEEALLKLLDGGARAADLEEDPLGEDVTGALLQRLSAASRALLENCGPSMRTLVPANQRTHDALGALDDTLAMLDGHADGATSRADFQAISARVRTSWDRRAVAKLKDWRRDDFTGKEELALGDREEEHARMAAELLTALGPFLELDTELLDTARRVVHGLLVEIEAELRRRGVLTFNDLLTWTRALLLGNPTVARAERRRLDQLLVDEFQDTDGLQCDIVRALGLPTSRTDRDEAPALFLVGDPKQSIFAWRNADLAAYDAFQRDVADAGGEVLALTQNFRSVPAVLREVELVIAPVMEHVPGVQPPFVPLVPHRDGDERAIEHWVSWTTDETGRVTPDERGSKGDSYVLEARALAADVVARHAAGEGRWKDFGVIFRAVTDIEAYLDALREAGVPYEVASDRRYYQRREVVDATALVRAVLDPNDLLALVTLLRSPMVGVPDAALLPLWEAQLPAGLARLHRPDAKRLTELETLIRTASRRVPDGVPGLEAIEGWEDSLIGAVHALAGARAAFRREPADVWVQELRRLFLPDAVEAARFLGVYRLANLERFFRELLRTLEEREGDVQSLLRTLRANLARDDKAEAGRPADSIEDAVQILTIHGAKGLEFRHVYLGQTHKDTKNRSEDDTVFDRRSGLVSYRLFKQPTPAHFETRAERKAADAAERVRLLYVALTRARDRLVVLGSWRIEPTSKDWRTASHFADLLESRSGATDAVQALAERAHAGDPEPVLDPGGATWRLAALSAAAPAAASAATEEREADSPERVRSDARRLAELRVDARARAARPFQSRASETHAELAGARTEARFATDPALRVGRDVALAVGTLVHRLLEDGPAETSRDELESELRRLLPDASAKELAAGATRALDLVERMQENGLAARLARLDVVARELPLLAPAGAYGGDPRDAPVGFVSGAIDLLYRDEGGVLVVADYKTDPVESEVELAERAAHYEAQGEVYIRAVQSALGLAEAPRFELWFLHAGRVVG